MGINVIRNLLFVVAAALIAVLAASVPVRARAADNGLRTNGLAANALSTNELHAHGLTFADTGRAAIFTVRTVTLPTGERLVAGR